MNKIEALRQKMIVGGDSPFTPQMCPADWQPLLTGQSAAQIAPTALALLSHQQALTSIPLPSMPLTEKPLLPPLDKPPVPEKHHYLLRQVMEDEYFLNLLYLLNARGYSLPAKFWRKKSHPLEIHFPATYAPWIAYSNHKKNIKEHLHAKNWADFSSTARLKLLETFRAEDPAAFRDLLTQCLKKEKAPERLEILQLFNQNLTPDDIPFLKNYQQDRSAKITNLIKDYLSRLSPNRKSEVLSQLKKHLIVTRQNNKISITFREGDAERIATYLNEVDIPLLAESLQLSIPELARASWKWIVFTHFDIQIFIKNLSHYLTNDDLFAFVQQYFTNFIQSGYFYNQTTRNLFSALPLTLEDKEKITLQILQNDSNYTNLFYCFLHILQHPFSPQSITFTELRKTKIWRELKRNPTFYDIYALGLLLPQEIAQEALTELAQSPKVEDLYHHKISLFSTLQLNIELPQLS